MNDIRSTYVKAENSQRFTDEGLKLIGKQREKTALLQAYEGAFEALKAKFSWNALYQFSQVNKAMQLLDRAAKRESDNAEIRYLRFSVGYFLPDFLKNQKTLQEDKAFLLSHFPFEAMAEDEKANIIKFLKERVKWSKREEGVLEGKAV